MSGPPAHDPDCAVRALAGPPGVVRLVSRTHAYQAEGQTSYAPSAEHPSSLDYLLGALASDLVAGLTRVAARSGTTLDEVELSLVAHLDNPLVALGVQGEEGTARLSTVRGRLYVSADVDDDALRVMWLEALRGAPVYCTLAAAAGMDVRLERVL